MAERDRTHRTAAELAARIADDRNAAELAARAAADPVLWHKLQRIYSEARTIAVVGASHDEAKPVSPDSRLPPAAAPA